MAYNLERPVDQEVSIEQLLEAEVAELNLPQDFGRLFIVSISQP